MCRIVSGERFNFLAMRRVISLVQQPHFLASNLARRRISFRSESATIERFVPATCSRCDEKNRSTLLSKNPTRRLLSLKINRRAGKPGRRQR